MEGITENAIKKRGGRIWETLTSLKRSIKEVDKRSFLFLSALGLASDAETYVNSLLLSEEEIENSFTSNSTPIYSKSEGEGSLSREEKRKVSVDYRQILIETKGFLHLRITKGDLIYLLRGCLYITPQGLGVDIVKYVEKYRSYIMSRESSLYVIQKRIVYQVNLLFQGQLKEELWDEYFVIEDGFLAIKEDKVEDLYKRYSKIR